MRPYERLSRFYDLDWSHFPLRYVPLVGGVASDLGLIRADVLDLACGTGVLALELSRQGHRVTGVDISAEMIAQARSKGDDRDEVVFYQADMGTIGFESCYDIVTCTFDAINYITETADLQHIFRAVCRALRPGGRFIFDSTTSHLFEVHHRGSYRRTLDGETFNQSCEYDRNLCIGTTTFVFRDGHTEVHRQRAYGEEDLVPLLGHAGLTVLDLWSGFDRAPAEPDSHRLFVMARREP